MTQSAWSRDHRLRTREARGVARIGSMSVLSSEGRVGERLVVHVTEEPSDRDDFEARVLEVGGTAPRPLANEALPLFNADLLAQCLEEAWSHGNVSRTTGSESVF